MAAMRFNLLAALAHQGYQVDFQVKETLADRKAPKAVPTARKAPKPDLGPLVDKASPCPKKGPVSLDRKGSK